MFQDKLFFLIHGQVPTRCPCTEDMWMILIPHPEADPIVYLHLTLFVKHRGKRDRCLVLYWKK